MIGAMMLAAALTLTPPPLFGSTDGPAPSAYTGAYYHADQETYRLCVAGREGRYNYDGTGSNGRYVGTYQMTRPLARGAVWMASKEWAKVYGKAQASRMRKALHSSDPTTWSREVWDQLFYTVLNWEGTASGARHWAGGRYPCRP